MSDLSAWPPGNVNETEGVKVNGYPGRVAETHDDVVFRLSNV